MADGHPSIVVTLAPLRPGRDRPCSERCPGSDEHHSELELDEEYRSRLALDRRYVFAT